jgi:hypothetical protein
LIPVLTAVFEWGIVSRTLNPVVACRRIKTGLPGIFSSAVCVGGGGGKKIGVEGDSHLETILQLSGTPILILPAPEGTG